MTLQTTRNDIINMALTLNGVKAISEDVDGDVLLLAAEILDDMVKEWQAAGAHLWTTLSATLFLQKDQKEYTIGPGTTDNATESFSETTTTAGASTNLIPVVSTAGMVLSDTVGIEQTNGFLSWQTVVAFSATTITVGQSITFAEDARVYYYTTDLGRALEIPDARRFTQAQGQTDGQEIEVYQYSRIDYLQLPNKDTSGTPTQYYFQRLRANGKMFVWPVPDNLNHRLEFTFYKPLDIFDDAADDADFPSEWLAALKYNLAVRTAPAGAMQQRPDVAAIAASTFQTVMGFDQEKTSILLTPTRTRTR